MNYLLAEYGKNGRNETWYRLRVNEATGELFHVKEWNNVPWKGRPDVSEEETPLAEAQDKTHYAEAVAKARELGLLP